MRRNIGCHTYRNTNSTIDDQIRKTCRHNFRFCFLTIIVRSKIYSIFINVTQQFHGNLAHSRLGISHSCSTITIHRTKVTMTLYKHITVTEILCHTYHSIINSSISMWMILTNNFTYDTCRLLKRLAGNNTQLIHRMQNTAMYRL